MYYLQSRYYDPEIGRFISADDLLATSCGVLEHNMYVYCNNNPINQMDSSGDISIAIVGLVIGIAALVISSFNNSSNTGVVSSLVEGVGSVASSVTSGVKNAVSTAKAKTRKKRDKNKRENMIYTLSKNGKVIYVGRTNDDKKTQRRHENNPYRADLHFDVIRENLNWWEARGLEQYYIMYYNTLNKANPANNQINGVRKSLWNSSEFGRYIEYGLKALLPESETKVGKSKEG